MVDNAPHDAVTLHLPELLDQHLLRHTRYRPLKIREPQDIAAEQVKQDHQLPPAFEQLQRGLDAFGRALPRVGPGLTFE